MTKEQMAVAQLNVLARQARKDGEANGSDSFGLISGQKFVTAMTLDDGTVVFVVHAPFRGPAANLIPKLRQALRIALDNE